MKVHYSIKEFNKKEHSSILTLGTFDGVHIGHQEIIRQLNQVKSENKETSVILTFFPHPRKVLNHHDDFKMINTIDEKIDLLSSFGLDHLVIEPFTKEFSRLTALEFVRDLLVNQFGITKLIIGYDHQFGKNREGNFEQLQEFGDLYGFEVIEINAQKIENISVSSTKIRKSLNEGEIEKTNRYLGYNFMLSGEIIKGEGLGRKLNYPTLNLSIKEDYKIIPKKGVYIVKTYLNDALYYGVMNIGFRPTVNGKNQTIEIHLLDFKGNLYGKQMRFEILKRLRNEQKFDSLEILIKEIQNDEMRAREWIVRNG